MILGDDLEVGVVAERYGLLRRQIVGHGLEQCSSPLPRQLLRPRLRPKPTINTSAAADAVPAESPVNLRNIAFIWKSLHLRCCKLSKRRPVGQLVE